MAAAPSADALAAIPPLAALDWAVHIVEGRKLLAVEPLRGGMSHANHRLRIAGRAWSIDVVLRRAGRADWLADDPEHSPRQEIATYGLLATSDVPAPRLLGADPRPDVCDVPALLLTHVPGRPVLRPRDMPAFLRGLADALPRVHAVDPAAAEAAVPPFRPFYRRDQLRPPAWTRHPELWERAIEHLDEAATHSARFIHRDYHPANALWAGGRLAAIVDWTLASFGPPEFDLAHMRANLALLYSNDAANAFIRAYGAVSTVSDYDPRWDLRAALDWVPELTPGSAPAAGLLRLEQLVSRALADIGG